MNELKNLRNEELISKTKSLVQEERNKTLLVIEYLQEIHSRRLHLKCGYSSLHEFLVKELSYSDGAAHRRISAMRLVHDVPEAKASIAEGKLSLTTVSQVQGFFQNEKKNRKKNYASHEKLELLARVEGASRQECERRLAEVSPAYREKSRMISLPEDEEIRSLLEEYRRLAMLSDGSPQSVIKSALRAAIAQAKKKQAQEAVRKSVQSARLAAGLNSQNRASSARLAADLNSQSGASSAKLSIGLRSPNVENALQNQATPEEQPSRYIPKPIKRKLWLRDQGKCVYRDPKARRQCGARHHLEIDHVHPYAMDGQTSTGNLQLLCRAHNQLRAFETYGNHAAGRKAVAVCVMTGRAVRALGNGPLSELKSAPESNFGFASASEFEAEAEAEAEAVSAPAPAPDSRARANSPQPD